MAGGTLGGVLTPRTGDARRVLVMFNSGAACVPIRKNGVARLNMDGADLSFLNSGRAPFLRDHDCYTSGVIGVVENAWIDRGAAWAIARFASIPKAEEAWSMVQDRILSNISMGFNWSDGDTEEEAEATGVIEKWRPHELSLVAVPADWRARGWVDAPQAALASLVTEAEERQRRDLAEVVQRAQRQQRSDLAAEIAPTVAARLGLDVEQVEAVMRDVAAGA